MKAPEEMRHDIAYATNCIMDSLQYLESYAGVIKDPRFIAVKATLDAQWELMVSLVEDMNEDNWEEFMAYMEMKTNLSSPYGKLCGSTQEGNENG